MDMILVIITIIIPIIFLKLNIELNLSIVPLFSTLYICFVFLNNDVHKLYLNKRQENNDEKEKKNNKKGLVKNILVLIIVGIYLFLVGELLGNTLENLCKNFNISETIIGIMLGIITSIPELITFFESQKHHKKENNDIEGVIEATNNLLTSNALNLFVIQTIGILIINI